MNKEQTPITAHDFYNSNANLTGYELMEQYAQAKVLEALEVEVIGLFVNLHVSCNCEECAPWKEAEIQRAKEYYETEVKPKYKL